MEHVLIIHEVEDYEAWKKIFDGATSIRKHAGELSCQVLKYDNNANKIVHFSKWTSIPDAKAFFESDKLAEIRDKRVLKRLNLCIWSCWKRVCCKDRIIPKRKSP